MIGARAIGTDTVGASIPMTQVRAGFDTLWAAIRAKSAPVIAATIRPSASN